jgi:hypothetical protein
MFSDQLANDWVTVMTNWSDRVALCREYARGDHRQNITPEMAALLRIDETDTLDHFNANYMQKVVDAMADRLIVSQMSVGDEAGQVWVDGVLKANRWDGMQMDLHEAVVRDGDSFIMAIWDEATGRVRMVHELAYDGDWGMIPIYARSDRTELYAAAKVVGMGDDEYLVYIYYHDRVETYISTSVHGDLQPYVNPSSSSSPSNGEESHVQAWAVGRFPVVHYANRPNTMTGLGSSELIAGIPLNDVINRTIMSMVAASELSAFQIMYLIGAAFDGKVTPGMVMVIGGDGIDKETMMMPEVGTLSQNSPVPFLEVIDNMVDKISDVTSTPIHLGGAVQSGEALKEREVALLSKVRRAQVKLGNKHEDVILLVADVARVFGVGDVPVLDDVSAVWMDAQVRNDKEMVENAEKTFNVTNDIELYLENISPVYNWDAEQRSSILERIEQQRRDVLTFASAPALNFEPVLNPLGDTA